MAELVHATGISVPTLKKVLNTIEERGLVKIDKTGRHFVYSIVLKELDHLIREVESE